MEKTNFACYIIHSENKLINKKTKGKNELRVCKELTTIIISWKQAKWVTSQPGWKDTQCTTATLIYFFLP